MTISAGMVSIARGAEPVARRSATRHSPGALLTYSELLSLDSLPVWSSIEDNADRVDSVLHGQVCLCLEEAQTSLHTWWCRVIGPSGVIGWINSDYVLEMK